MLLNKQVKKKLVFLQLFTSDFLQMNITKIHEAGFFYAKFIYTCNNNSYKI